MNERLVEQFDAHVTSGNTVRLYVYQDFIDAGSYDNPNATIPGLKRLVTAEGKHVNYVDDNTFKIVGTGETLKR